MFNCVCGAGKIRDARISMVCLHRYCAKCIEQYLRAKVPGRSVDTVHQQQAAAQTGTTTCLVFLLLHACSAAAQRLVWYHCSSSSSSSNKHQHCQGRVCRRFLNTYKPQLCTIQLDGCAMRMLFCAVLCCGQAW